RIRGRGWCSPCSRWPCWRRGRDSSRGSSPPWERRCERVRPPRAARRRCVEGVRELRIAHADAPRTRRPRPTARAVPGAGRHHA
ncbi:MAG: hypothetical protein ACK56F_02285, partial [bacterium]